MTQQIPPQANFPAQQVQEPAPQVAQQVQQPVQQPEPQIAPEDRILTPDETENLLRGYGIDKQPDTPEPPRSTDADQAQMAGEFFGPLPVQPAGAPVPGQVPLPHEQVQQAQQQGVQQQVAGGQQAVPHAAPAQLPQQYLDQAVQQSQQMGAPTAPVGAPQQVPVQQQVTPADAALQAQNMLLQSQVQTLTAQAAQRAQSQQPQQQQVQPGQQSQQQPQEQKFNFQVPPQFMDGLASEDPNARQYALNGLLNGVAEAVTMQMRQEMQQERQTVQNMVQSSIQETNRMQDVSRDMYGTYPELESLRSMVQATAQQVGQENPELQDWSPDLRDMIAERISPMVPGLYQKVQQIKAQRIGSYAVPQQPGQVPQPLPQQQAIPSSLPPGIQPVGVMGGVHGQPAPQTLARDAQGNLVYVQNPPQPYLGSPQARPDGRGVNPEQLDIWQTLGYAPY